jgi:hypothetical protein
LSGRSGYDWGQLELGDAVCLLLGWRDSDTGDLEAKPVELSSEVGAELLKAGRYGLATLKRKTRRDYASEASLEEDEFFSLSLESRSTGGDRADQVPGEDAKETGLSEEKLSAAELVGFVRGAFERDDYLTKSELGTGSWLFYVVVAILKDGEEPLGFVRQYNPQRGIKMGRLLTAFDRTLKRFDQPLFNFDFEFDVVIASDEIAVLKTTGFERVFSDLAVAVAHVPQHVESVETRLGVGFGPGSAAILTSICETRPRYAKRLRQLAGAPHLSKVTPDGLRKKLGQHGLEEEMFGAGNDLELKDRDDVAVLLDMLEQRYYEGDFTDEHLRADRMSKLKR